MCDSALGVETDGLCAFVQMTLLGRQSMTIAQFSSAGFSVLIQDVCVCVCVATLCIFKLWYHINFVECIYAACVLLSVP
jgi:hypothetical protein